MAKELVGAAGAIGTLFASRRRRRIAIGRTASSTAFLTMNILSVPLCLCENPSRHVDERSLANYSDSFL